MIVFVFLFCVLTSRALGGTPCTSSAKIAMSRDFLPAALPAATPLGFGTCNKSNGTCLTPPANCPESSCCLNGIQSDSCGCAEDGEDLGPEWGDTMCSDPKALRFAVDTCDAGGARHSVQLQLYTTPASEDCQEGASVQVVKEEGTTQVRIQFSVCKTHPENLRGHRGLGSCRGGIGVGCGFQGGGLGGNVGIGIGGR